MINLGQNKENEWSKRSVRLWSSWIHQVGMLCLLVRTFCRVSDRQKAKAECALALPVGWVDVLGGLADGWDISFPLPTRGRRGWVSSNGEPTRRRWPAWQGLGQWRLALGLHLGRTYRAGFWTLESHADVPTAPNVYASRRNQRGRILVLLLHHHLESVFVRANWKSCGKGELGLANKTTEVSLYILYFIEHKYQQ